MCIKHNLEKIVNITRNQCILLDFFLVQVVNKHY